MDDGVSKRMLRYADWWGFVGLGAEIVEIRWIKDGLNQQGGLKTHKWRPFCDPWTYEGATISRKTVAIVSLSRG